MTTVAIAKAARTARRTSRNRYGRTVTSAVMVIILLAFLVLLVHPGVFAHTSPLANGDDSLALPSASHLFGTDQLGRDVFSRVIYGAQPVLEASLGGVLLATLAGVAIGLVGGTAPRLVSIVVMRIVDVLLALPVLLIALILIATIGAGVKSIILALGVAYTPGFARVVEASVRKLRSIEFVQAAKMFGSSGVRTAVRHLLPNLVTEVVVMVSSAVGWAVLTATTLSFLGLGVQLPNPDWGSDLAAGATSLSTAWWLSTFPGIAITVTILVANFAGDWVMTLIDPSGRRALTRFRAFGGLRTSLPSAEAEPVPESGREPGPSTAPEEKA
ncbi:MAG: peptide/nickel transport system permease protein [Kribbellaceae bacterium]|nr:peptide/nickel transport system permease protein [Kribbellaceae bacterium]